MTGPLLVGEAPSKVGDRYHAFPLSGRPAEVLCKLAGIPPEPEGSRYGKWTWALYSKFTCRNVFERHADATPWRAPEARGRAIELLTAEQPRVVVCLGRRVQAAVYGALDFRTVKGKGSAWGGLFGNYGAWVSPHMRNPDVVQRDGSRVRYHETAADPWLVTIPHPSGLNRLLNSPAHRAACGKILREALELAASGGTVLPSA